MDERSPSPNSDSDKDEYDKYGRPITPEPTSGPCTCRCGGCCCHGTSGSPPQHCVRCHRNYTLNHSSACMVPHVFFSGSDEGGPRDVTIRSACCGSHVIGGEPIKGDWEQPYPCFMGWHTTDVAAVEEQYNGINVLRCDPGSGGKCMRRQMRHRAHYDHVYDDKIKYNKIDKKDKRRYVKKEVKREDWDVYEDSGGEEEEV